jgi:pyruvate/2-oxoglutarate dehydrogenase complex dihydrolipoamide dehydrogenase (E3) component
MSMLAAITLVQGEVLFEMNEDKQELTIPESFPVDELMDLTTLKSMPKSIVIIGAGISGIKTAHVLVSKGYKGPITIVEGYSEVGGRMRTQEFAGVTVEQGANWVSGITKTKHHKVIRTNPLWKLAQACSL